MPKFPGFQDGGVSLFYRFTKRCLDIVFSLLALICFLPLGSVIALAICFESKGSVIFKQERIGFGGQAFNVFKFRTMTVDSDTYGLKPVSFEDERLTRVGLFLRRCSLDELPQLLNVIKGEMSLVGPRPEMPFLVARYEEWQRARLKVLPGMTGWWQVNGRKQPMHDFVEEDLFYIQNRSLWFDVKIILLTVRAVISREGAL